MPGKHHEMFENLEKAREFCRREAKARINNMEDRSCPQDLIEAFVLKMEEVINFVNIPLTSSSIQYVLMYTLSCGKSM